MPSLVSRARGNPFLQCFVVLSVPPESTSRTSSTLWYGRANGSGVALETRYRAACRAHQECDRAVVSPVGRPGRRRLPVRLRPPLATDGQAGSAPRVPVAPDPHHRAAWHGAAHGWVVA